VTKVITHRIECSEVWGGIANCEARVSTSGLNAALYSSSASGAKGGDIYYLSVCDSDLLTRVVIADVVGHGEDVSQMSQFIYDALIRNMNMVGNGVLLAEINRIAIEKGISAMTTAVVASYYKPNGEFCFSYAGHHPILVKRTTRSSWQELNVNKPETHGSIFNTPLGIIPEAIYTQELISLNENDRLLFYTDGLIEAANPQGIQYGIERLKSDLQEKSNLSPICTQNMILEGIRRYVGGPIGRDDVTMLMVELAP